MELPTALRFILVNFFLGVRAQPPPDIDPDDTEGIIEAFRSNASRSGMDSASVNLLLEKIFRQSAEKWAPPQRGQPRRRKGLEGGRPRSGCSIAFSWAGVGGIRTRNHEGEEPDEEPQHEDPIIELGDISPDWDSSSA